MKVTAVVAVILYTVLVRVDVTMYMNRPLLVGFSLWDGVTNASPSSSASILVADGEMARATSAAAPVASQINELSWLLYGYLNVPWRAKSLGQRLRESWKLYCCS